MKVQELFGDRLGRDVFIYSITLDAEVDTPEVLAEYRDLYEAAPGWTFLTGDFDDIEHLRHKLGAYDPDPIVDKDKTQHAGLVIYGNEAIGRWAGIPGLARPSRIVRSVERVMTPNRGEPVGG